MRTIVKTMLSSVGYKLVLSNSIPPTPRELNPDVTDAEWETWQLVEPYTMTSLERVLAAIRAVTHISENAIPGDIVECGVWRGGSSMAMASTLKRLRETSRRLFLFDTYEGMTPPTRDDVDLRGSKASNLLENSRTADWVLACASLEDVHANMTKVGYGNVEYVKGPVEETIPERAPDSISILRLDTDWYTSTKHELEHLYHRLSPGGILIIDDYGHWQGARKAVDEFFGGKAFLSRIDYTGRLMVKP